MLTFLSSCQGKGKFECLLNMVRGNEGLDGGIGIHDSLNI